MFKLGEKFLADLSTSRSCYDRRTKRISFACIIQPNENCFYNKSPFAAKDGLAKWKGVEGAYRRNHT